MLWQAETGFAYRIAGGRLGNLPPSEQRWRPVLQALAGAQTTPEATGQLPAFLREHGVDAIVVVPSQTRNRVERLVATLGVEPAHIADALRLPAVYSGAVTSTAARAARPPTVT